MCVRRRPFLFTFLPCYLIVLALGSVIRAGDTPRVVLPDAVELSGNAESVSPAHGDTSCSTELPTEQERHFGICETMWQSMVGQPDPSRPWNPLLFSTFWSEGWFEPWIAPPDGGSGAVRQGWINDFEAFFNRNVFGVYNYGIGSKGLPNSEQGIGVYETPLSRRYMFGVIVPAVNSLEGGGASSRTGFGDITVENRFMLEETENFTLSANLNITTPTGDKLIGADRTSLFPFLAFWTDVGHGWSIRGGVGVQVPFDSKPDGVDGTGIINLCVGQTLTRHAAAPFGDFTYFVCGNYQQSWGVTSHSFVSLTPGFRTHLGDNWFLLGGIQVSVTSPRPFDEQFTVVIVKGF